MFLSTVLILVVVALDIFVYYLSEQHFDDEGIKAATSSLDKKSRHEEEDDDAGIDDSSPSSSGQRFRRFSLAEIKAATCDFDEGLVIGKGGFGKVYKGTIDLGSKTVVAIKRLKGDSNQGAAEFWTEIEMLSKFRHSHIVSLLGYCEAANEQEMILVYEYMPNGSLEDHVHKRRSNGNNYEPLTWVQRLDICIGAARGLDYLHTGTSVVQRVIHRDVKSSNILLDENWAGKISDFGLSRIGPVYQSRTTDVYTDKIMGTFGYMDAEYYLTHRLTRKSDVYAFGVVLFEVLCGRAAVDFTLDEEQHSLAGWVKQCQQQETMGRIVNPYLRGQISDSCLKEFTEIAYKCISRCPKDRPTMAEVVARLELALVLASQVIQMTIVEKAWSLLWNKGPDHSRNPKTKKQQRRGGNRKNFVVMEEPPTTTTEKRSIDNENNDVLIEDATVSITEGSSVDENEHVIIEKPTVATREDRCAITMPEAEPLNTQMVKPYLMIYTFAELRSTTKRFQSLGEFDDQSVSEGLVFTNAYTGIADAIKMSNTDNILCLKEGQAPPVSKFLGKAGALGLQVLHSLGSSMTNSNAHTTKISILAFEVANTIVKGSNLMQSVSDINIMILKDEILYSKGVSLLVSTDMMELFTIAAADKREELKVFSQEVARFGNMCKARKWHNLDRAFVLVKDKVLPEEVETKRHELTNLAQYTSELYHNCNALDKLYDNLHHLNDVESMPSRRKGDSLVILQSQIKQQRKLVRSLKKKSLWCKGFEEVVEKLLDIVIFIHQSIIEAFREHESSRMAGKVNTKPERLGVSGLTLHYAKLISQIDNIASHPTSLRPHMRDTLYDALPGSLKAFLRVHLQTRDSKEGITMAQIKAEMDKVLQWLVPVVTNTIKAHQGFGGVGEWAKTSQPRELGKKSGGGNMIRLQTLYHADKQKMDEYILDLIIWLHHLIHLAMTSLLSHPSPLKTVRKSESQQLVMRAMLFSARKDQFGYVNDCDMLDVLDGLGN